MNFGRIIMRQGVKPGQFQSCNFWQSSRERETQLTQKKNMSAETENLKYLQFMKTKDQK